MNPIIIIIIGGIVTIFLLIVILVKRYRKCGPNEVMVISGRKGRRVSPEGVREEVGYRIVKGGGAFIWPVLERVDILSLENMTLDVKCVDVYTEEGVPITVDGVAIVKVKGDDESIATAAEQFLSRGEELSEIGNVATQTLEGHLRAILAKLSVEEVYQDRDKFAQSVLEVADADMGNMGLMIVAFTIRDVQDEQGYLDAVGKRRTAEVQRDAEIGKAQAERDAKIKSALAEQDAEIGKLAAETGIAASKRDFEVKQAEYEMEINMKKAEAELAGELQKYITSQEVKREEVLVEVAEKKTQIDVAEQEILRKQKELEATIEKQAEADKYQIEKQAEAEKFKAEAIGLGEAEAIGTAGFAEAEAERIKGIAEAEVIKATGEAEAEAMMKKAEAWQSYNKAAITEILIEKLPEIAKAVAEPLAKTEKIIMISGSSGAGVSKITSGATNILAQLPPILEGLSGVSVKDLIGKISGVKTMEEVATEDIEDAEVDMDVATEDVEVDSEEAEEESG
ncbi:MAG: flotillin family protein [Deltaproteobacteria bacterium]|nr:flotillin family protein [Deltaproteobacteria bacterium]